MMQTRAQYDAAVARGHLRTEWAIAHGAVHRNDGYVVDDETRKRNDGFSAAGEDLVARTTGREALSLNRIGPDNGDPDIRGGIEVHQSGFGRYLVVWKHNPAKFVYVLVAGRDYPLTIAGWLEGAYCKHPQYFLKKGTRLRGVGITQGDGYWVPRSELLDPELRELKLRPGEDPDALLARLASPEELMRHVGRRAFNIVYDDGIVINRHTERERQP